MQRVAACKPTSHGMFMRRRRVTQSSAEQSSDSAPEKDCHTKREEMVKENRLEQQRTCRKKNGHRRRIGPREIDEEIVTVKVSIMNRTP